MQIGFCSMLPRVTEASFFICAIVLITVQHAASGDFREWLNHGGDISNTRFAKTEYQISTRTASHLQQTWTFDAGLMVTATPAIADGILYFPSWIGNIYAVNATSGALIWQQNLANLTGITSALARASPAVYGQYLLIGLRGPAMILGLQRSDGSLIWKTLLDPHPMGIITMSGTPFKGAFYVGTSSLEEIGNASLCCTFQGSFNKLNITDGSIIWKTLMLPYNHGSQVGYSGAALWGSSPSIDPQRNLIYIATGNDYRLPQNVTLCEQQQLNRSTPIVPDPCAIPGNHAESILALDLDAGTIKWSTPLGGYDAFTVTCLVNRSAPNCPPTLGPDYDFGEAPMLLTVPVNSKHGEVQCRDIVVAGQKSGVVWALDRDTGSIVWSTVAGPGGETGGATWGSATDGKRIYTNIANSQRKNFTLVPSTAITTAGGWVAMDASTGKVLWTKANPDGISQATAPVTVANGVVFVGSYDPKGFVYALDANTGDILWNATTGSTVQGGFAIANGCAYIGTGYTMPGRLLFAFCLPKKLCDT
ncbi:hypothetical protein O6H91_Y219300 [Diphasiastrum complanatum]|nr:hypothetical protein O6H91_Y219300 [Diphasiastrum complanatum]